MNTWSAWAATIAQTFTSTRTPILAHRRHRRFVAYDSSTSSLHNVFVCFNSSETSRFRSSHESISSHINSWIKKHIPPAGFFPVRKQNRRPPLSRQSHFSRVTSYSRVDIVDFLARGGDPQVRKFSYEIFHLAGRISLALVPGAVEETCIDLFSKDTYDKSLRIQRGNDVNISRISGKAPQRKRSVTIAFNFTDSFVSSRNPFFRDTRHSLVRDHIDLRFVRRTLSDGEPLTLEGPRCRLYNYYLRLVDSRRARARAHGRVVSNEMFEIARRVTSRDSGGIKTAEKEFAGHSRFFIFFY